MYYSTGQRSSMRMAERDAFATKVQSHDAIRTMQSHHAILTIRFHESICTVQSHEAVIPLQSTRCDLASNLHDAIPCNDTMRTMRSHTKQFNPHDAIPRTMWSYARCNPMHDAIPRTTQSHGRYNPTYIRCNSTKPPTQPLQYTKGRPGQMVHGGVDKKGKRDFAIFTYLLSAKCHPQRPWRCR